MQIVVLSGFVAVLFLLKMPLCGAPAWAVFAMLAVYLLGAAVLGRLKTIWSMCGLRDAEYIPTAVIRRYNIMTILGRLWLVGGFAASIILGYGHWLVEELSLARLPLLDKAAALAPAWPC